MKKYLVLVSIVCSQFLFSQSIEIPKKKIQKGYTKIDFLSINMPEAELLNEANMGFTGIHFNTFLNDWAYAGVGLYGAVTGARGGFFTLGVNAGIKNYFTNRLYVDTGFHFGGGGGAGASDGGGAFILPHVNLGHQFENFSINAGWSYVNFFDNGRIKNHQLNIGLEIPLDYSYADYSLSETNYEVSDLQKSDWNVAPKRNSLMVHFNNMKVLSKAMSTDNQVLEGKIIRLAGFEYTSYIDKKWFTFLKVDGAYDGIRAGFMDVFLGAGYHFAMNNNKTNILAKFGFGAGGGGGVDSKGGFLMYPDISLEQQVFKDIYVAINKGYMLTPNKHFYTSSLGFGIKYYLNRNGIKVDNITSTQAKLKGVEAIVKQDLYVNAKRMDNPSEDLHQISLQVNVALNKNVYVAGQTSFANFGNAGAYAEGLVGMGAKTNPLLNNSTTLFTQVLGGAAGGGNISTGQGFIVKPSVGLEYKLNKTLGVRTALGYVKARGGELSSPFVNLGINYHFSFLKLK